MTNANDQQKANKLQALEIARQLVENDQEIPTDYCRILFPPEKREYELTYFGKESKEQILSNTISVPLQEDKIFPPNVEIKENEWVNKLIFGENLQILKTLIQMKKDGKLKNGDGTDGVRLIYIDPPFATQQEFKARGEEQVAYADKLSGVAFIEFTRKRIILAKELLSDDGCICVHLDNKMAHYIKIILDEIFNKNNFRNEIIWSYSTQGRPGDRFAQKHDQIFVYGKTQRTFFNVEESKVSYSQDYLDSHFTDVDDKGKRCRIRIDAGKQRIYYPEDGMIPNDVWDIPYENSMSKNRTGYPTQKPEKLLEKVIKFATKKDDIVLDFFVGSGTTPAVAEKLNRRWIAVDVGKYAIYTTQKRLLQIENIAPFILYSGGLYDADKLNKFDSENWKLFALQLWSCQVRKKEIKGLKFDGEKDNCLVKVYSPQELKSSNSKISYETINEIDLIIGKNTGNELFIIAPQGQFTFAEDEIEIGNRCYHILRVPYSLLAKFTEDFTPPTQPRDSDSVNEIVEAVGFDFIQPPMVEFEINKNILQIKKFSSNSRLKGERKSELSMLLIDYDYDGEIFNVDDVFYNKDLYEKDKKTKARILKKKITIKKIKNKAMLIFIDNAGNEKKVIVNG